MSTSNVYISLTEGSRQLVIDGPIDLLQKFLLTIIERPDQPDPHPEPIIPPKGAIS
jgi:hypothetical protein